jgi:hypothetical protein
LSSSRLRELTEKENRRSKKRLEGSRKRKGKEKRLSKGLKENVRRKRRRQKRSAKNSPMNLRKRTPQRVISFLDCLAQANVSIDGS